MSTIRFDAIAGITVYALEERGKMFQPFYLRSNPGRYGNLWNVFHNQDRGKSWIDANDIGRVAAMQYRSDRIIIAVTTHSPEFAHAFAEWLRQHCGARILSNLRTLPVKPVKRIGRKLLACNEWAYEQHVILKKPYTDIFEEWKQRYKKENQEDPDEVLANPLRSLRQAVSTQKKSAYQEM